MYDAVALSYGAAADRDLGVPGESLKGVIPARRFVGWYNGTPEDRDLKPDLGRGDSAVIIGQGNVALDIARILISPSETLRQTDITDHSLTLRDSSSTIRNVYIVGRRGPLQVAFTIKELREMIKLPNCVTEIDEDGKKQLKLVKDRMEVIPRPRKRLIELLIKTAEGDIDNNKNNNNTNNNNNGDIAEAKQFKVNLVFLKSPLEILGDGDGHVRAIRLGPNELVGPLGEDQSVLPLPPCFSVEIPCGLVIKSIGYKSVQIDEEIPFSNRHGIIPNTRGRVEGEPGLYCSGWVRRGPTGVIVTTMNDAFETGKVIVEDLNAGVLPDGPKEEKCILDLLRERNVETVNFSDWELLDAFEKAEGEKVGKPREKLTDVADMFKVLGR